MVANGHQVGGRQLRGTRWKRAGVRGERRKMDAAEVEAVIRCVRGILRAVITGRDLFLKCERKHSREDKGGGRGGEGMGEEPERGGVLCEVDPARGPARCVTGTQGTGRREPLQTTGMGHRALRGGKGGSRAFGQCPRKRGGRRSRGCDPRKILGGKGGGSQGTRCGSSRGCRTLGTRRGRGQRGGRGVTGHGDRADGADRADCSRGGGRRGGSTANHRSGSTPTSRRGWLERGIQPGADLLAESLSLELG